MQVRLLTSLASPFASFPYGSLYECEPEEGARLCAAGMAENVSGETLPEVTDETDAPDGDEAAADASDATDPADGSQASAGNAAAAPRARRRRS
jgi:hypothetical protein